MWMPQKTLGPLVDYLVTSFSKETPLVWALHPRTLGRLREFGLWEQVKEAPGIHLINPVGYLDMLRLNLGAKAGVDRQRWDPRRMLCDRDAVHHVA